MLYRFLLVVPLTLFMVPAANSAPDVERAMSRAEQRADEMHRRTSELFDKADALSTSPEFLEGLNREATKAMENAGSAPTLALPDLPTPSPELLQRARSDINKLLDQAQDNGQPSQNPMDQKRGPQLYVFVSFSMPEITIKRLLVQASRIDGSLILRGLVDGDLGRTREKITQLLEADASGHTKINGGFAIDPTLFERFAITRVPGFVLTDAPAQQCNDAGCPSSDYVRLAGDTTIEYALETMAREAPVSLKESAHILLDRLKGGSSP